MNKEEFYNQFALAHSQNDGELTNRLVEFYVDLPPEDKKFYHLQFLNEPGPCDSFANYVHTQIGKYFLESMGIEPAAHVKEMYGW
jgi:hypothetical protein